MKKIILLCLLTLSIKSQVTTSGTVILTSTSPNNVCRGEDITINFKFKYSGIPDVVQGYWFHFVSNSQVFYNIKTFTYEEFYGLNKNFNGVDTIYSFSYNVPLSIPFDQYRVEVNITNEFPGKTIFIVDCGTVGIKELELDKEIKYFDLWQNQIEPRKGDLIIQQIGTERYKIIMQ